MPLNTRASFTLSTPSMAGRIAGLLQSSLQTAVTAVCYFPMISWWLAYITVNIYWKNIHAHNMLFLRLTTSRALFYLSPTWYDVVGRLVSLHFLISEPSKKSGMAVAGDSWLDQTAANDSWSFARTGRVVSRNIITVTARALSRIPASLGLQEFSTGGW